MDNQTTQISAEQTKEKILVVDDDYLSLRALEETIKREGYTVIPSSSGEEAVKKMKGEAPIAMIICDQRMPGMKGIDVLKEALKIQPEAIRIILTGNNDLETVIQAINIGQVSQFIVKPWEDIILRQVINTSMEKYRLKRENDKLHNLILIQHKELAETHATLSQEIQLGARIHSSLLLGKVPRVPGFFISAATIPSKDIDGDFFEFYRSSPEVIDVVMGDVMGKGLPAALVGIAVKTQLMRFAVPYIPSHIYEHTEGVWRDDLLSPKEILIHVQKEIVSQLIALEFFVSLFYGRFNLDKWVFSFVDCGSTKPIHYRSESKKISLLQGGNFPLGTVEHDTFNMIDVPFSPEDFFIFYSDGVTEAKSPEGELYGMDRLLALVEKNTSQNAEEILTKIKQEVLQFTTKTSLDDDLTLIVIKVGHPPMAKTARQVTAKFINDLSEIGSLRNFVHRLCLKAPGDIEKLSSQLQLAINEAFCNIVKHGYKNEKREFVIVKAELLKDGILFQLSDRGQTFDPSQVPEPNLSGEKESGFGWFIIKEIADKISYIQKESEAGWNHLNIFKRYYRDEEKMEIDHKTQDGVLIITPMGGSLDAKEVPLFKEKVINIISNDHIQEVILDLHHINFIDSSGLGSFLSVLRILHTRGGELKLANMNKPIRTMFELVSMHKIFEIFNSNEEAIRSFNA